MEVIEIEFIASQESPEVQTAFIKREINATVVSPTEKNCFDEIEGQR